MSRNQLARDAFFGKNDALYAVVCDKLSYELDRETYAANGCTLAECIAVVENLTDDDMAELECLGIVC